MMNNTFMPVTPLFNHNDIPVMNPSVKCVEFDIARNTLGVRDKIDADDYEIITTVQRGTRKPATRATRRKNTINAKRHTKRIANYSYDIINPVTGKIKDSGWKSYLKGDKVYVRKPHEYKAEENDGMDDLIPFWEAADDGDFDEWTYTADGSCISTGDDVMLIHHDPVEEDDRYIYVRQWSNELHDHIITKYPNTEKYCEVFLREKGLFDEFLKWLENY